MSAVYLFCFSLTAFLLWFVMSPYLGARSGVETLSGDRERALVDHKERQLQSLRDLELDFQTGKISSEDFGQMKAQLHGELARVMRELDTQ